MPTGVPSAALSAMEPPATPSESVGCDGAALVTSMVKFWLDDAVPSLASTVMTYLCPAAAVLS